MSWPRLCRWLLLLAAPLSAAPRLDVAAGYPAVMAAAEAQVMRAWPDLAALQAAPAGDPSFGDLARYALLRGVGGDGLAAVTGQPDGPAFLNAFLGDQAWVEEFLCNGPTNQAKALRALYLLWHNEPASFATPLYHRLATAFALQQNGASDYNLVTDYRLYLKNHREGRLHANFDTLPLYAMRFATEGGDPADIAYLSRTWELPLPRSYDVCWACAYRGFNDFGDTIQGPLYYQPWRWQLHQQESSQRNGGVCGALSTYGSFTARVHGIPSSTAGQPGHCAHVIRGWDGVWGIAYNVDFPTDVHVNFWGGQYTFTYLMEDVFGAHGSQVLPAQRAAWYAELLADRAARGGPHPVGPWTCAVYAGGHFADPAKQAPESQTTLTDFTFADLRAYSVHGAIYNGEIEAPADGDLRLEMNSDDGARLAIDGKVVLNTNCSSAAATVRLTRGRHACRVEYYDSGGAYYLNVAIAPTWQPQVAAAYALANRLHPLHLGLWREAQNYLVGAKADAATRQVFAVNLANSLQQHQEAAWTQLTDAPLYDGLSSEGRGRLLLTLNRILTEPAVAHYVDYPYDRYVGAEMNVLGGGGQQQLSYFKELLALHQDSKRYFAWLLTWGNGRFGGDKALAGPYADLLAEILGDSRDEGRRNQLRDALRGAIVSACRDGDGRAVGRFAALAEKCFPREVEGLAPRYLNPAQKKAYPAVRPYPGQIVSANAALQSSSQSNGDRPFLLPALLGDPSQGGFAQTNAEEHPWFKLVLPGPALLTGLALVTRYELPAERDSSFPLTVAVSADDRKWQSVATIDQPQALVQLDLLAQKLKVKYLKLEANRSGKPGILVFRNILVYGQPLY
jgi:hypothetical protein